MLLLRAVLLLLLLATPAWADLQIAVGHFATTTQIAGNTVAVATSPAFTPKCVLFWWSHRTDTTNSVGRANASFGVGFASSPTARTSDALYISDNVATTDVQSLRSNVAAVTVTAPGGINGQLDVQSFNADGFTLIIDDAFSASFIVHYVSLGGSDITNCAVGSFTTGAGTGDVAVSTVGFQPDAVWLTDATFVATDPTNTNTLGFSVGVAAGVTPTNAVTAVYSSIDGTDPTNSKRYSRAGESWASWSTAGAITGRGSITAWTPSGFTFNRIEASSNKTIHFLALKGPKMIVGNALTQTNTTTDIVTGNYGFTPALVVVGSHLTTASAADTPQDDIELSLGAATSTAVSRALAIRDQDNAATTAAASAIEYGASIAPVLLNISSAHAIEGRMKIQSFDANGVTFRMDDADPTASFFWYWAIGSPPNLVPPTGFSTVTGNSWQQADGVATPVNGFSVIRWSTASGPNQQAACTISTIPDTDGDTFQVSFRIVNAATRSRFFVTRVAGANNDTATLEEIVGGVVTTLAGPINLGVDIQSGDQIGVDVASGAITGNYWSVAAAWLSLCAGGGDWCTVTTGTATTTPGTSYIGMGAAPDASCALFAGTLSAVTQDTEPPSTPGNCTAAVGAPADTQLLLTCNPSTDNVGVVSYVDEQCAGAGCSTFAPIRDSAATAWPATGLTPDTLYRHRRRAWDGVQYGAYSTIFEGTTLAAPDTVAPSVPQNCATSGATDSSLTLICNPSQDDVGVVSYQDERCPGTGCNTFAIIRDSPSTTYVDEDLAQGTVYRYRRAACDQVQCSAVSAIFEGTTTVPPGSPTAPTGFRLEP